MAEINTPQLPTPDPALKPLDRLVGTWRTEGHPVGSDEITIEGETTFRWRPGGFFLEQHNVMSFMGLEIDSLELIGFDPQSGTLQSTVFSNLAPTPLPYRWEIDGDVLRISVSYGPLDATFTGNFAADDKSFAGGWRPNPGADQTVNVPYDIAGRRVK